MNLPATWPPAPEGKPPAKPVRLAYIIDLMRSALWVRGESGKLLAAHWGLSAKQVRHEASDASHVVRARLDEVDVSVLRAQVVNELRWASRQARLVKDDPAKAGKLAVDAAKAFAEVTGAGAPKRQQVQVTAGDDDAPWLAKTDE
jgi:hypothetical protein